MLKGSFFLRRKGSLSEVWLRKAPSFLMQEMPLLPMQEGLFIYCKKGFFFLRRKGSFLDAERLTLSVVWLGKAQFL